jgi:hypothetical protein
MVDRNTEVPPRTSEVEKQEQSDEERATGR